MKMDGDTVEKLIEIVRGHVFLYDIGHQDYKNAHLKWKMWEQIGKQLNLSSDVVKNKWKTIRDGYTKYKKLSKSAKRSNKKVVTYTWASQLRFLDYFNSRSNDQDDSNSSQNIPSPLPWTPQLHRIKTEESPANTSTASTSTIPPLKRSSEIKREDAKKKRRLDVIDNLFLTYADTFKRFPAREQAIVKLELAKLFSNIELQLIDNKSVESNFNYYAPIASPTSSTASSVENQTVASQPTQEVKVEVDYLE